MPRRKRFLDDGDSSSGDEDDDDDDNFDPNENADERAERRLFANPYHHKRRRVSDEDDEDGLEADLAPRRTTARRSNWTEAPAFVSRSNADVEMKDVHAEDSDDSDDLEPSKPPSPRVREDEADAEQEEPSPMLGGGRPRIGGIGSRNNAPSTFSKGGLGSAFAKSGMAAFSKAAAEPPPSSSADAPPTTHDFPPAFGNRGKPSFVRDTSSPRPATPLTASEKAHFGKISGSIGAKLLSKMGWQEGTGLGASGEGIVTPVESKLRPQKMGMGFRGFKEKTDQSRAEARRRGEAVSDDEQSPAVRKAKKKEMEAREQMSDVWKRPKKVKTKVEHKTYEQIIAEAGQDTPAAAGIGQIIDATGAVPREISSLADISLNAWTPAHDLARIPEVRHNIRLISDTCKTDLDGLAREAKALDERKQFVAREDLRLRKRVEEEAELIARLQQVQIMANDIDAKSKELASVYEASLEDFTPLFYKLVSEFAREVEKYRLDEVIVAAIAPLVRRIVSTWNPLDVPMELLATFRNWKPALRIKAEQVPKPTQVDIFGSRTAPPVEMHACLLFHSAFPNHHHYSEQPMTPFESLLWNVWLPKVRTSINNDWDPQDPQPAIRLYEAWSSFLPPFIRDNMLDQLILPKVKKAVADWNPKRAAVSLRSIIFPWLPHLDLRMEDVVGDARRKVKSLLRNWVVGNDIPPDLSAWRDVFDAAEWDAMLLKYVVPKLGATLRDDFRVNPRNQVLTPLTNVLLWVDIIRSSIFAQILETEFFPKWLNVLHIWLVQPKVSFDEVARWYEEWKRPFPDKVLDIPGISRGFTRGLQLMNKAIELGPEAPTLLLRPDYRAELASANSTGRSPAPGSALRRPSARTQEITFRSIVEDYAAAHNLLFMPSGKVDEVSRMPLFRVSESADGKGGILVYVLDDAVWAGIGENGAYRAISLEDMVAKALA
ncbi:Tuftelin-interacting protein 11 [Mycena kentingensis (nom. inval.)]|nr:Tuftelin-interacting protein 11 [Mycena kentingensis (nom. inval.)]